MFIGDTVTHIILNESIDITETIKYFKSLSENEWDKFKLRQNRFDVHQQTKTIGAIWTEGNNLNTEYIPQYYSHIKHFDLLIKLVINAAKNKYKNNMEVVRAMVVKLPSGKSIPEHIDSAIIFNNAHRIHIPIVNNELVKFTVDNKTIPMHVGTIVEINNRKMHGVINNSKIDRLQFICDLRPIKL